jgi:prevent-host-death family protein
MSEHVSTLDVRRRLGDILNRVHLRHDRFVIERKGTALAAVVPVETLDAMERLSREFLLDVLSRRREGDASDAEADVIADEAKHRSRKNSRSRRRK